MVSVFEAISWVEQAVRDLRPGQFLVVDYAAGVPGAEPYAQLATDGSAFYLEVASSYYLPAEVWPLDTRALAVSGWQAPDGETSNWWRYESDPHEAATLWVRSLQTARSCVDLQQLVVTIGAFPGPPDDGERRPARERAAA